MKYNEYDDDGDDKPKTSRHRMEHPANRADERASVKRSSSLNSR